MPVKTGQFLISGERPAEETLIKSEIRLCRISGGGGASPRLPQADL